MFLYRRSDVEGVEKVDEEGRINLREEQHNNVQELVLSLAKNRQGALATIGYQFYGHYCRFVEQKEFKPLISSKQKKKAKKYED